jgi:hypothetical protein
MALLQQQQGGGASTFFYDWLGLAAEWDSYVKRDKEAGSLLLHLLKTGGCWCSYCSLFCLMCRSLLLLLGALCWLAWAPSCDSVLYVMVG